MCRLVAYLGPPTSAKAIVFGGDHSLVEQSWQPRELLSGSVNADGYGVVWYSDGQPRRIAEARPIWYDDGLATTLEALHSGCVVAALRNTTRGLPVDRSGLLPLTWGRWSFVLNGFVPDFRRDHMRALRALLPDDLYSSLGGSSDSETLFYLGIDALRRGASSREALEEVAARVRERVGRGTEAQLNMVLSDGTAVAAVRSASVPATNSLYLARGPALAPDGVVLASERLDTTSVWEAVDGHSWIEISAGGSVESDGLS